MHGLWKSIRSGASKMSSHRRVIGRWPQRQVEKSACCETRSARPLPDSATPSPLPPPLASRPTRICNSDEAAAGGIATVRWPGRLERLSEQPAVYLDGTHNPAGAKEVGEILEGKFRGPANHLVYGAMRDKAVDEIAGLLFPRADTVILTEPRQPRAVSAPRSL